MDFKPSDFENKWKASWQENEIYKVKNDPSKPKFYVLDMFPYPSGAGLHVGHPLGYIASDIYARYKRLKGYNVLHPMGYDAFGLPAEQYAIQSGKHPAIATDENTKKYRAQLDNMGLSFDWSREVKTCDPQYYKWTQWIFLQLYHHYFDKSLNKAAPISDLVNIFEKYGNQNLKAAHSHDGFFSAADWNRMSEKEKDDVLMDYRLAYRTVGYVNWCPALGTVLANDEVKDGVSERGGYPIEKKAMKQWSLRITAYAERLLDSLESVEWSDSLKNMQKNWIGRSEGAQLFFKLEKSEDTIEIFTTRPDTIFGATYMVLAPEHDLVNKITTKEQEAIIEEYLKYVNSRSEVERMAEVKDVTGAFTGAYAINPFTEKKIPIYIGEYVLKDYGTGAIMAVPSDDERDQRFAQKFGLEIIDVVDKSKYPGATLHDKIGVIINSGFLSGLEVPEAIDKVNGQIEEMGIGKRKINYKLRDANFSRQRYWGEPFPIKYDKNGVSHPLSMEELPLELPDLDDYKPTSTGKSPLAKLESWVNVDDYERETDTMPGFAGSSWYYFRYMDANNNKEFASQEALNYWKQVDLYIGGTEHAVGHLMYSRFWNKFLFDLGYVPMEEPFKKLVNQGMIQGVIENIFLLKQKIMGQARFVSADLVDDEDDYAKLPVHIDFVENYGSSESYLGKEGLTEFLKWRPDYSGATFETNAGIFGEADLPDGIQFHTQSEVGKMSKRYFNVVNPDDVVDRYGADCFRMYEMFLGPIEQSKPWDTKGIDGVYKFLRKFWGLFYDEMDLVVEDSEPTNEEYRILHRTIKKVQEDIERLSFNTAVSSFMVCTNELKKLGTKSTRILTPLLRLLAPFAPFITEEIYSNLGHKESIHNTSFPKLDEKYLVENTIEYPVCINGKKRETLVVDANVNPKEIEAMALKLDAIQKWVEGKQIKKIIVVPKRMINVVV